MVEPLHLWPVLPQGSSPLCGPPGDSSQSTKAVSDYKVLYLG